MQVLQGLFIARFGDIIGIIQPKKLQRQPLSLLHFHHFPFFFGHMADGNIDPVMVAVTIFSVIIG